MSLYDELMDRGKDELAKEASRIDDDVSDVKHAIKRILDDEVPFTDVITELEEVHRKLEKINSRLY